MEEERRLENKECARCSMLDVSLEESESGVDAACGGQRSLERHRRWPGAIPLRVPNLAMISSVYPNLLY